MTKKKPSKMSRRGLRRPASDSAPEAEAARAAPERKRSRPKGTAARRVATPDPVSAGEEAPSAATAPTIGQPRLDASQAIDAPADLLVAAASIVERLAAFGAGPDEPAAADEPIEPRLPLRERARLRAGSAQLLLFRVGTEWFATDLAAAEEAIELPQVHHVPEMPESMLGMFDLRGRMIPVYAPARVLGVPLRSTAAATLVLRGGDQRVGIAVDDVEDVLTLDLAQLRDLPGTDDADGVILGVARHGRDLVAVLDADALVAACLSDRVMESL
jgi:purine-binding chemotaxis protein CheW